MDGAGTEDSNVMDLCRTGPGTIGGRNPRQFRHPVMRADDLPPRSARPIRIMGEKFTLY